MQNPPLNLPDAVARAWRAETRMRSGPSAARRLANSARRRAPRSLNGARVRDHALITITRVDADWLQTQADYLATSRPAAVAVLARAFLDSCRLAPGDTAPLIAAWIQRRHQRARRVKYPVAQSVRLATLADIDAIATAFDRHSRGAAFELIVYTLRNLDGASIADET